MRDLRNYGSFVGRLGLQMLVAQDVENKFSEVGRKRCKDCGRPLYEHHVDDTGATCPAVVMGANGSH